MSSCEADKGKGAERNRDGFHVVVCGGKVKTESCSVAKRKPTLACGKFMRCR